MTNNLFDIYKASLKKHKDISALDKANEALIQKYIPKEKPKKDNSDELLKREQERENRNKTYFSGIVKFSKKFKRNSLNYDINEVYRFIKEFYSRELKTEFTSANMSPKYKFYLKNIIKWFFFDDSIQAQHPQNSNCIVKGEKTQGCVIYSPTNGCGKTSLIQALSKIGYNNTEVSRGRKVDYITSCPTYEVKFQKFFMSIPFTTATELFAVIEADDSYQEYLNRKQDQAILCIDDLGQECKKGNFGKNIPEIFSAFLKNRIENPETTTLITTNLSLSQLKERYGNAVASRLQQFNWFIIDDMNHDYRADKQIIGSF